MKMIGKSLFLVALASSQILLASAANAAGWKTCNDKKQTWGGDATTMYLSTTSFPIDSEWDKHTQYMMSEWNSVGGSNFKFYVGRDTDNSVRSGNGRNEVYFLTENNETYLGVTKLRWTCYWLFGTKKGYDEADISINTRYSWTLSDFTGSTSGSPYNFELVMLHELGHALGLNHYDGVPGTMNTYYYNGGPNGHYNQVEPHADDRHGLRILYPDSSTDRDLSVSRFYNTGGGSSSVNRVRTTSNLNTTSLNKGSQYKIRYTLENLGTQTESATVKFYISTNSYISTGDTYLGSTSWSMPGASFTQSEKTVTIPSSLASGTYYIGYRVDPDNNVPESNESNNFVSLYHSVRVN